MPPFQGGGVSQFQTDGGWYSHIICIVSIADASFSLSDLF